jgi:hypothetical protein
MKTSPRLEAAITKIYNAFHNNELNPECCKQCAVGNILDKTDSWKHLSDDHGSVQLNYVGKVHQTLGRKFNGYTPLELLQIETIFLEACGYELPINYKNKKPKDTDNKEVLFKGVQAVIAFLCKLDNTPNVMDYSKLFVFENNEPKHKISYILK